MHSNGVKKMQEMYNSDDDQPFLKKYKVFHQTIEKEFRLKKLNLIFKQYVLFNIEDIKSINFVVFLLKIRLKLIRISHL